MNRLLLHIRHSEIRLAIAQKNAIDTAGHLYDSDDDSSEHNIETPPSAVLGPHGGLFSLNGAASLFGLRVNLDDYAHHDHAAIVPTRTDSLPVAS